MIERVTPSPSQHLLDRVPPHSVEAEVALLGSLLMDVGNEAMGSVVPLVRADDFYRTAHRKVYEAFLAIYERGDPIDPVIMLTECERRGILEEVGGSEFLARLAGSVVGPTNAEHYARIVREKAVARGVIRVASDLQRAAYDDEAGGEQLLEMAEHRIFELSRSQDDGQATSVHLLIEKAFQELDRRDGAPSGLRTHFFQFDDLTAGLHPGELMIVAGRPSMGKTTFALNVAYNVAVLEKVPTVIFSLEMSRQQIAKNILCSHADVEAQKLRGGRFLSDADYRRLSEAGGPLYDAPLYIDDTPALSTTVLRAKARRLRSKHGIGLVIIDYLQLMEAMGASKNVESRQQEISYISRSLKGLARELDVPIVALSQLNRQADAREDHRPRLSDLRECVTGDTLVCLADGRRVPIADLVGTTPRVLSTSPRGEIVPAASDLVWPVGRRAVLRLRLASGRSLRATGRHRLYGARGWTRVEDLAVGDRLAIARALPAAEDPLGVRTPMRERGISTRERARPRGTGYGGASHLRSAPSGGTMLEYGEILHDARLRERATDDLSWDRVVSIEPAGEEDVFDLTVPGPASWLADGIVSHNSGAVEQDADVVCFLFRKHYYTKAPSDRGLAELIVAKQRNGPTDTVQLAFQDQFMRFDNFAPGAQGA